MSEHIKFNVIIPTRERADTLYHCLCTVVAQKYDNLNIIVSDNFSQDNTREVVALFSDPRIKYINTGKRVSMSHNWEFALSHVTDGWVTFVGDDDGLLPDALSTVNKVALETGCKAITSKVCHYLWPNSGVTDNSRLTIPLSKGFEIRDSKVWLSKLMNGYAYYPQLPFLYTGGFADLEIVNNARSKDGIFFLSMTPDIYSAIALSSIIDKYVILYEPVAIGGTSSHSTGSAGFGYSKNPDSAIKYFSENNISFHQMLGSCQIRSMQMLVYECYLQAYHLHDDFLKVKMTDQLARCIASAKTEVYDHVVQYCREVAHKNKISETSLENKLFVKKLTFKAFFYINHLIKALTCVEISGCQLNISNIFEATWVSKSIYFQLKKNPWWRTRQLFSSVLRFISMNRSRRLLIVEHLIGIIRKVQ